MELTKELIRKHKGRILSILNEASMELDEVTVKSHQRRSKKGKAYTVKQFERDVKKMTLDHLKHEVSVNGPLAAEARAELRLRRDARHANDDVFTSKKEPAQHYGIGGSKLPWSMKRKNPK